MILGVTLMLSVLQILSDVFLNKKKLFLSWSKKKLFFQFLHLQLLKNLINSFLPGAHLKSTLFLCNVHYHRSLLPSLSIKIIPPYCVQVLLQFGGSLGSEPMYSVSYNQKLQDGKKALIFIRFELSCFKIPIKFFFITFTYLQ